jgi:nucleotide-binding universal stress UspA family protein
MKVLFCTDGSEISLYAIEKALTLIKKDFEIDIVTVMETGFLTTFVTFPYEVEVGFPEYQNTAEKTLEDTANFIESKGFKVGEKIQLTGYPADMILDLISGNNYSAVILGSHGKKGFKRWLGSVSRKIAYKSPIPIFIIKPVKNHEVTEKNKEILITVDGSQNSYSAVRKAFELIDFKGSSVEILSVKAGIEDFPFEIRTDEEWLNKCLAKQDEIMNEILEKTSKILEENNIKPDKKTLLQGDPAEEILKYTEKNHKDIIIMGSHGRESLSHLILGSVSKIILDNVNASVLIIQNKPVHK